MTESEKRAQLAWTELERVRLEHLDRVPVFADALLKQTPAARPRAEKIMGLRTEAIRAQVRFDGIGDTERVVAGEEAYARFLAEFRPLIAAAEKEKSDALRLEAKALEESVARAEGALEAYRARAGEYNGSLGEFPAGALSRWFAGKRPIALPSQNTDAR